ncbi:hypothetical protein HDV00_002959 [Rhizophlyctis rosea]|nr:hypothetical protein HDV00_002959 [Rhizophlyctis rosea]
MPSTVIWNWIDPATWTEYSFSPAQSEALEALRRSDSRGFVNFCPINPTWVADLGQMTFKDLNVPAKQNGLRRIELRPPKKQDSRRGKKRDLPITSAGDVYAQGMVSFTSQPPLTIGVELELIFPPVNNQKLRIEELEKALTSAGILCQYHREVTHDVTPHWKLLEDKSIQCSNYETAVEIVSPILTLDTLGGLRDVMTAVRGFHPKVNFSTGLHVHIGLRPAPTDFSLETVRRICLAYLDRSKEIEAYFHESRQGNKNPYCQSHDHVSRSAINSAANFDTLIATMNPDGGRYYKLNLRSLYHQPTIEFRGHHGTNYPEKAEAWVTFLVGFVHQAALTAPKTSAANDGKYVPNVINTPPGPSPTIPQPGPTIPQPGPSIPQPHIPPYQDPKIVYVIPAAPVRVVLLANAEGTAVPPLPAVILIT